MPFFAQIGSTVFNLLLVIGLISISINIQELKQLQDDLSLMISKQSSSKTVSVSNLNSRVAWIDGHGDEPLTTYMLHIVEVFQMMGYKVITGPQKDNVEWDVMWIHDYSLTKPEYMKHIMNATSSQIINHVPGSGYYTSKVALATCGLSTGVPQAFQLPHEKEPFLNFAKEHMDYLWVQKDNTHRNIKIASLEQLNLNRPNSFIQRYIENPFLIDGRKFDIGVYTVITSIKPLKVYVFAGDALLRFCPQDYEPFDPSNIDKYVVGDDYTPIWEIESLREYFVDHKMGWRQSFDTYLLKKGLNPMTIWQQVGSIIAEVFQRRQPDMINQMETNNIPSKFFELSRFDFIVDDELNVYLMEANMSPNLSSGHFKEQKFLYEQVILNVLSLVGLGNRLNKESVTALRERQYHENSLENERDLRVIMTECTDGSCSDCDNDVLCKLCGHCMTEDISTLLRSTYSEHLNRRQMMRVQFNNEKSLPYTKEDYILGTWLKLKCKDDPTWCN